jgi:hypothetical protein
MVDFVNRNYYAGLMSNTNWIQVLGHNFRTIAKAAAGFYDALR